MAKKKKPREERKPEDYMASADDSLELAKVLAGQGAISDQDFLERMARSDEMVDHDGTTCGLCHYIILGAQAAREMIEAGAYEATGPPKRAGAGKRASSSSAGWKNRRPVAIRGRHSRNGAGSRSGGHCEIANWKPAQKTEEILSRFPFQPRGPIDAQKDAEFLASVPAILNGLDGVLEELGDFSARLEHNPVPLLESFQVKK